MEKNLFPSNAIITDRTIEINEELRGRPLRSTWRRGPWDSEPDIVSWTDEVTGLECLIVRTSLGSLCGYVGVPATHPWAGMAYSGCINGHAPLTHDVRKAKKQKWYDEAKAADDADSTDNTRSWLRIAELSLRPFIDDSFADSFFRNHDEWECTDYSDGTCSTPERILDAHGGVTFAGMRDSYHMEKKQCPFCVGRTGMIASTCEDCLGSGEVSIPSTLWWFGFDCGHYQDFSPGMDATSRELDEKYGAGRHGSREPESYDEATGTMTKYGMPETYRPMAYVKAEVEALAIQLKGIMRKELPSGGTHTLVTDQA